MITEDNLKAVFEAEDGDHIEVPVIAWVDGSAMVASRTGKLVQAPGQPGFLGLWDPPSGVTGEQYTKGFTRVFGMKPRSKRLFLRQVRCLP